MCKNILCTTQNSKVKSKNDKDKNMKITKDGKRTSETKESQLQNKIRLINSLNNRKVQEKLIINI